MGDIIFNCQYCGKSLVIDSRGAGLCVKCTDCGRELIVPLVSDAVEVVPEIRERPKLRLKRDVKPVQPSSAGFSMDYRQKKPKRIIGIKWSNQEYGGNMLVAFLIAFLIAAAGNAAWNWLASHFGDMPGEIGGLLVLVIPLYVATRIVKRNGFLIGILCVMTYLCGIFAGDVILINYMDSTVHRNINRNREVLVDYYAVILAVHNAEENGKVIQNDVQLEKWFQLALPEAQKILPTMPQEEFDELFTIWLEELRNDFREMPIEEKITTSINWNTETGENALFLILGIGVSFWIGVSGKSDS